MARAQLLTVSTMTFSKNQAKKWMAGYTPIVFIYCKTTEQRVKVRKQTFFSFFLFKQNILSLRHYQLPKGCHLPLKFLVSLPLSCALSWIRHVIEQRSLWDHHTWAQGITMLSNTLFCIWFQKQMSDYWLFQLGSCLFIH